MSLNLFDHPSCQNIILSLLSAEEYERFSPHLQIIALSANQVLYHSGDALPYVYLPLDVVIHLYSAAESGETIQVSSIGPEGMLGFASLLGAESFNYNAVVLNAGRALRIRTGVIKEEFDRNRHFQQLIFLYNNFFCAQLIQTAACNRLHSLKNRLPHWLLACDDHLKTDWLKVTHNFISQMLGTQRSYVTTGINQLNNEGVVECRRGFIKITDRRRLEENSCECYEFFQSESKVLKDASLLLSKHNASK